MRLDRVQIKNFRSIQEIEIKFEPTCRVLVGINESGKTNILKALALLAPDRLPTKDDIREFPPDEDPNDLAEVNFIFVLDKSERLKAFEEFSEKVMAADISAPIADYDGKPMSLAQIFDTRSEIIYEVDLRTGKKRFIGWDFTERIALRGAWVKPAGTSMTLHMSDGTSQSASEFDLIDGSIGNIADITPEGYVVVPGFEFIDEDAFSTAITQALPSIIKDALPQCVYWSYNEANLLPGQINVDTFASNPDSCVPLKHMFALAGHLDVATAIKSAKERANGLRNLLKRVADVSTEHMHSVWKEYHGISIQLLPNGDNIDATINDTYNVYDLSRRSDGFKRFITFLLLVSAQAKTNELVNTLYLHDEPDASLHPSGARHLRDELIKISEGNYVVYSTHSIFMIDRDMVGRHLIVEKKDEVTSVAEVDVSNIVDEEVIYNALGYSIFETLRQKNIVFEGWRDKKLFQVALSRVPAEHRGIKPVLSQVGVCHANGVKDIGRVTPMLELANRECLIVSDNDQVSRERQKDYDNYGTWLRYDQILDLCPAVTGEDFVKSDAFRPVIKRLRAEDASLPEFKFEDLQVKSGRLAIIQKWLEGAGMENRKVKTILNSVKEEIFTNLKPSQIEPSYYALLEQLVTKF